IIFKILCSNLDKWPRETKEDNCQSLGNGTPLIQPQHKGSPSSSTRLVTTRRPRKQLSRDLRVWLQVQSLRVKTTIRRNVILNLHEKRRDGFVSANSVEEVDDKEAEPVSCCKLVFFLLHFFGVQK
ncbi:unnamed protein product, partial [Brassica oleracea]